MEESRGRIGAWIRSDPVRAVSWALIALQVAWRPQIAARGYLAFDDFTLASQAAQSHLSLGYLTSLFNNHFMPAAMLIGWLVTHGAGLAYWPYVLLMAAGQAAVSIAFYRLVRTVLRPGWGQLVPLVLFLFSPLTLELDSWWAVGVNLLPMQLAMVLAIGAQVRYVRTRRPRHLVSLGAALVLGLLFFEKSLLIVPLVFLVTACLYVPGGPVRSVLRALTGYWQSWLVLVGVGLAYGAVYLPRAQAPSLQSSLHAPASASQAVTFVRDLLLATLVPGLFGGPWRWLPVGDGAPVTATPDLLRWITLAAFVALVVATCLARRVAVRAWVLLLAYVVLVSTVLGLTRLGYFFSTLAGLAPRYVGDVAVVAALCVGVAVIGLREPEPVRAAPADEKAAPADEEAAPVHGEPAPVHEEPAAPAGGRRHARGRGVLAALRTREGMAVGLAVLLGGYLLSSAWSAARFGDEWQHKQGRDFLKTAEEDLAAEPPDAVFLDQPVPEGVQSALNWPYNLESNFFRPATLRPEFASQAEYPWIFDSAGHMRRARVQGVDIVHSSQTACGYVLRAGQTVRIPLANTLYQWQWVVRIGYVSSGDSIASLRLGTGVAWFDVSQGLHQVIFLIQGAGDAVELTVQSPSITLCTNDITVGQAVPSP